jgi:hypothetical protein
MAVVANLLAALFAFGAAAFWFASARVKIPAPETYWDQMPETAPFLIAFRRSISLSRNAAICAAISAILTAISIAGSNFQPWPH